MKGNNVRSPSVSGIGSAYALSKILTVDMDMFPPSQPFEGKNMLFVVQMSNINSATEITMRVCYDTAGDQMLVTDTKSDIYTGITTATKGTVIFSLNSFVQLTVAGDLHVFCKTNTGTVDIDYVTIMYEGER